MHYVKQLSKTQRFFARTLNLLHLDLLQVNTATDILYLSLVKIRYKYIMRQILKSFRNLSIEYPCWNRIQKCYILVITLTFDVQYLKWGQWGFSWPTIFARRVRFQRLLEIQRMGTISILHNHLFKIWR